MLWQAGAWREELIQLLPWALPVPLPVHGHYTRAEIEAAYCFAEACGYGVLTDDAPWIHREGVLWNDLALGPALFYSESQSTTTAASSTGQRTIHHEARGSLVLLFVPEQRKQDGCPGGPIGLVLCFWPRDLQRA